MRIFPIAIALGLTLAGPVLASYPDCGLALFHLDWSLLKLSVALLAASCLARAQVPTVGQKAEGRIVCAIRAWK